MVPHLVGCGKAPPLVRQQWVEYLKVDTAKKQQTRIAITTQVTSGGPPVCASAATSTGGPSAMGVGRTQITQEQFDFAFARMMFGCALSFVLVESPFFRQFIELLAPGLVIPSRHKLAGPILQRMRDECRQYVITVIKQQRVVSVVTDAWSDTNNSSIINFMVVAPGMPSLFWSSLPTGTAQHTGAYMAKELKRVIKEVQHETGAVVSSVLTDNASNMVSAWAILKSKLPIFAGGCAAHTINLLIQDVFKLSYFTTVRKEAVLVTKFVRDHHALLDEFGNLQATVIQAHDTFVDQFRSLHQAATLPSSDRRRALVIPIQTRWYTLHACLRSVLSNMTIIKKLFSASDNSELLKRFQVTPANRALLDKVSAIIDDPDFWQRLEHAVKLIDPIIEVLRELDSDKCATSKVYSLYRRLKMHDSYATINRALPAGFRLRSKVTSTLDDFMENDMNTSVTAAVNFARRANLLENTSEAEFTAALYAFGSMKRGWLAAEKAQYAAASPSHWWDSNEQAYRTKFPRVYDLARLVFAVPTSSAASERAWSIFNFIHSKKRNRLTKDKVEKLAYIYINLAATSTLWIDLARIREYPESVVGP